ncbi:MULTISPECIES: CHASE2 domain-containing protein [unclassified Anabaena]|uniref:CHASE2 domain-containing protein n=1 Tax=unclassified Anabaena TaxID=2619674 RepID=UPI0014468C33|nr:MULTISPECIES: adenylate/guanylate cyclase domain-containing protein [unclassified Anabaena]MTJ08109.1 adenylate/guanylate cyclase domain-containing protein [Anabaena sp. UHCC 0204]MTJ53165.1 adenylate/guanylate cyclase domain-containing protein [Anabaena sp. UHCC 0253]
MWKNCKNLIWQGRGVWITTPSVAVFILLLRFGGLLQSWEWGAFDQYMRWRSPTPSDDRVVIVGINESDLTKLKQSSITDRKLAELLNKLKAKQPRVIGLDIYRDLPVEPGHQELVEVFNSTPNLVGIQKVVQDGGGNVVNPPPILKAKDQVGGNDLIFDADNKVRRGLFYVQDQNRETVYSFGLHLALRYLDKEGISPTEDWHIGKAAFVPFESNDGGYIRADARGYQVLLNYRGGNRHFQTVSMTDILEDKLPADWGRDRIILIGYAGDSFKDSFFTPYSSDLLGLPEPMNGVEIHANLTSQIISAAMENRPLIKNWSEPQEWLWIFLWSGIGATLTWKLRAQNLTLPRTVSLIIAAAVLGSSTYIAFLSGWWLPIVPSILALTGSVLAITAYIARTAGDIRKIFGRYLTDAVVANLLENPEGLKLGGERREITIFTSDLRGFTATSERLPPEEVVKILNFYLECMADIITKHQGTIDEFMGDGILVLFGAPTAKEDDAVRAVACGVEMQLAMVKVNAQMKEWGLPALEMGIGINTGVVVVGNIGSEKRTKYGIVGSQVNLTYRIESYTIGGQIFISESTFKQVESIVKIDGQRQVTPKGVKEPITIYEVGGITGQYNLFLSQEQEELLTLPTPIPVQYAVLEGKDIGDIIFKGSLVKLSIREAELLLDNNESPELPAGLSNLKLNLLNPNNPAEAEDIYAKVLEKPAGNHRFYIYFTVKPPAVTTKLNCLLEEIKSHNSIPAPN